VAIEVREFLCDDWCGDILAVFLPRRGHPRRTDLKLMAPGLPTPPSASGAPSFLTVAEVATMLRVSKMTVYRMVHSGDLPAMQVGRSFRVPERAVHDYLAAGLGDWGHDTSEASGS